MEPKVHLLKIWPKFYEPLITGHKWFEIRKNDRLFLVGDILNLQEWNPSTGEGYTGRACLRRVTYVFPGGQFGLAEDYVVMSLQVV